MMMRNVWLRGLCGLAAWALVACSPVADAPPQAALRTPPPAPSPAPSSAPSPATQDAATEPAVPATERPGADEEYARPTWLGTRVLPRRADGYGEVLPTPRRLRDRRLATPDVLPRPPDARFASSVRRVPADVLARSTWSPLCPVTRRELRYVTVTFHGFDGLAHTGELLVHRTVARDLVAVFRTLYRERFPIEEMRVVRAEELDLPPTGDGNNTTAFVCRPSRGATSWSEHAYGRAVDVNPFHNPYVKGDLVLPELASAYTARDRRRPGMIHPGDAVTAAFAAIGWRWGGDWRSLKDWMHFSQSGR